MGHNPLLSIIINNHNYGKFLPAAIDSALAQEYSPVEIIVVDDGSIDDSRQVIAHYRHQIIPILKENGGQASAFNTGFAKSCGEIVIFLDADDMLLPSTARRIANVFQSDPQVAKIMYRMEIIDAAGRCTGVLWPYPHLPVYSGDIRRYELVFPFDLTWMATSGNAFSARVLQQIFPVPEQAYGRICADWYLSHLTPLFGNVHFLPQVGAYYRVHGMNNYQLSGQRLDLGQIRQSIYYAQQTQIQLKKFADQLSIEGRPARAEDILSVSYIANRLISLKLEPQQHPILGDRLPGLFQLGTIAALRRFDISWPVKVIFIAWFALAAVAPRPLARWLAEIFSLPEKRAALNQLFSAQRKKSG